MDAEEELDSEDSLAGLMDPGEFDFPSTCEINASLYESKNGQEIINPSDFIHQQQLSCFHSQTTG